MMGIFALGLGFVAAADKDAKTTAYVVQMTGLLELAVKVCPCGIHERVQCTNIVIAKGDTPKTQKVTFFF